MISQFILLLGSHVSFLLTDRFHKISVATQSYEFQDTVRDKRLRQQSRPREAMLSETGICMYQGQASLSGQMREGAINVVGTIPQELYLAEWHKQA